MISNLIKTASTAAVVAVLGFGALAAAPAQAAPGVSIQLGLGGTPGYGPGYGPGFGMHHNPGVHFEYNDGARYCLENGEIRSKLRNRGFRNIQIVQNYGPRYVIAVGVKYGNWYQMRVNRCTGTVDHIQRVNKRANGGFSIQLNF